VTCILLIEDDSTLGDLLRVELDRAGYECVWARDASTGLDAFHAHHPALVLLDLMLPDYSGFFVLERLREVSQVPVIVLTARHLSSDKVRGLDLGADDYMTKPFWNEELLARVRARLRRNTAPQAARRVSFGAVCIDLDARTVTISGETEHLSPTEYALLVYLVERDGRAVRGEQLAEAVLTGEDTTRTALQTHVSRLRRKLGEDGQRIRTVWGIGYRFDSGDDDA
jgi:DNA-binding response OmpR family regulator